jgi:hypothetical protein
MHVEAALRAVEDEVPRARAQGRLHLQELEPEHLRVDDNRMIASTSSLRLVHELIGVDGLLSHGPDGVLEDLALSAAIDSKLDQRTDYVAGVGRRSASGPRAVTSLTRIAGRSRSRRTGPGTSTISVTSQAPSSHLGMNLKTCRGAGLESNESARSESGSMRTWSSSARTAEGITQKMEEPPGEEGSASGVPVPVPSRVRRLRTGAPGP